jgi:adenine-specific DNA-methyltransferase
MMKLNNTYNRDDFLQFLGEDFLTDFKKDVRPASTQGLSSIQKAYSLGRSESLDLQVFEFSFEGSPNKRVTLTKEAFQVMRSYAIFQALAIFHSPGSDDWRLSLMTATPERSENGKVALTYSNPKRLSFFLGPNAKVNTPTKFILKRERIIDFEDLRSRFSIEVVNKEFYKEISKLFTQLVGGSVQNGTKRENYESLLKLPSIQDKSQTSLEFAVRLIGRVIFCWFLREKKSEQGKSLMPNDLLSLEAVKQNHDYYHSILEPIFFEVLNKPVKSRKVGYDVEPFSSIPYLNGGLFSPHDDDFFSYNEDKQSVNHNTVVIPDEWIRSFFDVLETYNFTIDENTSFDEELSIDPEMLGRIFENLLAEISPETGESARKSTGSYYTPRVIVDYMVDESLLLYLKDQTQVEEAKLRAALSYDLTDNKENQLTEREREQVIGALEKIKILDPACGSGAFPIGALQKIVFILQQADPEGHLWFKKQIKNTSPELRRVVEREFVHKNFDYIRKLGIIRENIYGVDIQPIATEISRLRCFLTLVVDERIQEDLENRGIEPLPNLDFKFVTANSLVGLPGSQKNSQIGLFEDEAGIRELKELRDMFFTASGAERDQLKLQFVQAQNRMFQRLISEGIRGHADLTTKLSTWDPFSHKSASWFDTEWMFGVKDGFDIVIANPPFVFTRGSDFTSEFKKIISTNYTVGKGKINLFSLFVEIASRLLRSKGIYAYILPNTFFRATSYKTTRKFVVDNNKIILIVDLHAGVFENVTASTTVLIAQNEVNTNSKVQIIEDINQIFSHIGIQRQISQNDFINEEYVYSIYLNSDSSQLIKKI